MAAEQNSYYLYKQSEEHLKLSKSQLKSYSIAKERMPIKTFENFQFNS